MSLALPSSLDSPAAAPLLSALRAALGTGQPVRLSGGEVAQVGQACLQVLASAQVAATARGVGFAIEGPSDELRAAAALAGLHALLGTAS